MCGSFSPTSDVTAAVAAQPEAPAKFPRLIPRSYRRFYKGVWQKPTQIGRGWQPSVGLANMTYEQGVTRLEYLNGNRPDPFINVTTPVQMPVRWSPNAVIEGDILTDPPEPSTPLMPTGFENFLNTEAAREENQVHEISATLPSEFAAPFAPIITKLENGGMALVVDSNTALTLLRGLGSMAGRDTQFTHPLMETAEQVYPAMVHAARTTALQSPVRFGFGAERA